MDRGRKRSDSTEHRPADKRACSSSEFRPSASSAPPLPRADRHMSDAVSTASDDPPQPSQSSDPPLPSAVSVSGTDSCRSDSDREDDNDDHRSEEEEDDDDGYDYDAYMDDERSTPTKEKLQRIVAGIDDPDPSLQVATLMELCETLSFSAEDSLQGLPVEAAAPSLVRLVSSDEFQTALLAARAVTYLCDAMPRAAEVLVRHGAIPVLCDRVLVVVYVDLAEQCVQALEKISKKQPVPCLQGGVIMAILTYIDFFSMSIQRVAVSTVANICKKIPLDCASIVMESAPNLCNLLQYEDQKLVEITVTCLLRIAECFSQSFELLDELCKHGVIIQSLQLISVDGRMNLGQTTYIGLIGLLGRLAAGSVVAVRTLFELNISNTLRGILTASDFSHGVPYSLRSDAQCSQAHEVLKLLNQLIPSAASDAEDIQLVLAKEKIITDQPNLIHQLSTDILPVLIQVVNSGANLTICYGCVSVINNIVYMSNHDVLLELIKNSNMSSFLAGLLARKDYHILILTLKIVETLMQKLPAVFLTSFTKEGVIYAIDALLMLENRPQSIVQESSVTQNLVNQMISGDSSRCLCYLFNSQRSSSSETRTCRLGKDAVLHLAKHIKSTYFTAEAANCEVGLTEILQKLKTLCAILNDSVGRSSSSDNCICTENEDYLSNILDQVMRELYGGDAMSTFEFIESGVVRSLAYYLTNGKYLHENFSYCDSTDHICTVLKRLQTFSRASLSEASQDCDDMLLLLLVRKLQNALSSLDNFPVILSHAFKPRNSLADIPVRRCTIYPCLRVHFVRDEGETNLCDYNDALIVELSSSLEDVEKVLWPKVTKKNDDQANQFGKKNGKKEVHTTSGSKCADELDAEETTPVIMGGYQESSSSSLKDLKNQELQFSQVDASSKQNNGDKRQNLVFFLKGKPLDQCSTLYQAILQEHVAQESDITIGPNFWNKVHVVTYKRAETEIDATQMASAASHSSPFGNKSASSWQLSFLTNLLLVELPCKLDKSSPSYDVLFLLKILEVLNRFSFHLLSHERIIAFANGRLHNLDDLKVVVSSASRDEFISSKLTDKLEQQMRDPLVLSTRGIPSWCSQLLTACPFLFSFEARWKYFHLTIFGPTRSQQNQILHSSSSSTSSVDRSLLLEHSSRKKFKVDRGNILESAAKMMASHACGKAIIEVEYSEEVGTGLGPTLEFYTLVSHEFQKVGLGMWREDHCSFTAQLHLGKSKAVGDSGFVVAPCGLFPRPWSAATGLTNGVEFSEVLKKFTLLGQLVAKAIKDGRILDLPFSRAFYKLILGQELGIYDIQSFDPDLGRTLLEFQALVERKKVVDSARGENLRIAPDLRFRNARIEDLCLDFTLPGDTDYVLAPENNSKMVNIENLEEYVSLVVDATARSGISRQMEAFKSGFNEVFPLRSLKIFTEDELERLLCGEQDTWDFNELLDHTKFDHGYTSSSLPVVNLLEIMQEFGNDQRRAFLQFVTGTPRLPPGGLAALNPKLTVVRKICSSNADMDLPSVMTCANYLKLPPYSTKEILKQRLLYAITEGQGSFHLS